MKTWILFGLIMLPLLGISQAVDTAAVNREVDSLIQVSRTLSGKRDFDKALEVNAAAEKIALEKLGQESAAYGSCCHNYGRVLFIQGNYTESEIWYLEAIAVRKKALGTEHPDYANSLNNLALLYQNKGNYEKTEQLHLEAKNVREKALGKEHPDYASSLHNLALLHSKLGNDEKAEQFYLEAIDIRKKVLGNEHADYAWSLHNLALLYQNKGNYEKAEPLYVEAITVREKALGKEHPDYAWSLFNLALLYYKKGNYEKAEPLYVEAITVREKALGKEHPDYARSLHNLALLYSGLSNYEKAEPLYLEAIDIRKKVLRKEHPDYGDNLNDLANLYYEKGNYEKAEPLYLEAKAVREKALGKEHPDYAQSLNNLAFLYSHLGNYKEAEPLYHEAIVIKEKAFGKADPRYAISLRNLASMYRQMGNYEKAELFNLEAKTIFEKALGKEHPDYGASLNNLALLYFDTGNYEKAKLLFLQAKAIYEKVLGKEHYEYARVLNNLAVLYGDMGNYKKAEQLHLETLTIKEKVQGKEHYEYARDLNNLAVLYSKTGNYEKAEPLFNELATTNQTLITKALHHLSERELNSYLNKFSKNQNQILSFAQLTGKKKTAATCFDNSLFYKGFLLSAANQVKRLALSDSISTEKYNLLKSYKRRLAAEYTKPIAERKNAPELEAKSDDLEKELARTVAGYGEAMQQVRWQEVQQKLQAGEAAIEFIHYRYYDKKQSDSIMYAALVLRPDDATPLFVSLFEEREITPLLKGAKGGNIRGINALYSAGRQSSLYDLIWKPLEEQLQGIKTVYCSPSGLLHKLNLGAIPLNEVETFAERHKLVLLGSTRQLVIPNATKNTGNDAFIVGGVRYDADSTTINNAMNNFLASTRGMALADELPLHTDSISRGDSWNYLPGTATEAQDISRILQSAHMATQLDTGYLALEESFRSLGMNKLSPHILHVATHGFFFPDPKNREEGRGMRNDEPVFKMSDNPMIRSGLILAGAQQAWSTGKAPENREDGILTAYEISQMNLSNTELVVLSACETGLGDIEGNEGVYGLQRAFKIAGAKYLIMSLWKVNDQSTRELMTDFYQQWLSNGLSIPEAFRTAQQNMKGKYKDPYHWAGFVLVE